MGTSNMLQLPQFIENIKATSLFQKTPCSPCGTILFRTKPICSKHMHRLVSVHIDHRWKIQIQVAPLYFSLLRAKNTNCDFVFFGITPRSVQQISSAVFKLPKCVYQGQINKGNALLLFRGFLISSFNCLYKRDHRFRELVALQLVKS